MSTSNVIQSVVDAAAEILSGAYIEKCLLFAPDAVGAFLWKTQRHLFQQVEMHAPIQVPLLSVMPTKTPVCFTSMLTGSMPQVHGVYTMEGQTLTCDTLFDSLIRGGKRVALATTWGGCMNYFFRGRDKVLYRWPRKDARKTW